MARPLKKMWNNGLVTSRPKEELGPGELQQATGVYYKPGDKNSAYKIDGRSTFGDTATAAKVDGLALCLFDSGGTDKLLALSNSVLYGATPGATGTPASLFTPSTSPTSLDAAHFNDTWYLAMGTENRVLKSDGTTRPMSMKAPGELLSLVADAAGSILERPTANDAGWSDMADAYDTSVNTASYASASSSGSTVGVWSGFGADTGTGRKVHVLWGLQGEGGWMADIWSDALGGVSDLGAVVTVKFEYSFNAGSSWTTIAQHTLSKPKNKSWASIGITDSTDLSGNFQVRATLTYTTGTKQVSLLVYDIKVLDTGQTGDKSATDMLYSYREWDETNLIGSVLAPVSKITFTSKASVTGTLPSAAVNSNATHWQIFRSPSQGTESQMGYVLEVPIAETTFTDDFSQYGTDEQPVELIPFIEFEAEGSTIRIPRDGEAPNLRRIAYFKGGLVGLTDVNPRALYYAVPGFPESWPALYYIDSFPLPEHDTLKDVVEVGGSLIVAAQAAMIRLDEVPRSVAGVFIASPAVPIAGAPGCVGDQALTAVPYKGRSHAAWISPENGILVTDGHEWDTISRDLDWSAFDGFDKSGWVLHYLRHLRTLVFAYSSTSGGTNDRYYLLHMDDDHIKQGGQAKISGPHYGKITAIASGQVSSTTRIYEAHTSDGKVYLNLDSTTGADSSNAYNSDGDSPLIVEDGEFRDHGWASISVLDGKLHHGDFGSGETASVEVTTGRDASGASSAETKTVSLAGQQGHQMFLARSAGEWVTTKITHTGTGRGYLGSMTYRVRVQGDEGEQKVVA